MGCNVSELSVGPELIAETKFGILKMSIVGFHRQGIQQNSALESYMTFKMTNQSYRVHIFSQSNYESNGEVYTFIINSRYQLHGRALVVELWEKGMLADSSKGIGMLDINSILQKKQQTKVKVYLNDQKIKIGWVEVKFSFDQMPTEIITLMFDSALIRRRTSKAMKCKVKVIIGEETLSTMSSEDKQDKTPTWKDDIMVFYSIKDIIKIGKIVVMDDQTEVGSLELNMQQIGQSNENQIQVNEEFHYENNIVAGTLRFFINKGQNKEFKAAETTKSIFVGPKRAGVKLPPLKKQQNVEKQLTEEQKQKKALQEEKLRQQERKKQEERIAEQQQKRQAHQKIVELTMQIEESKVKARTLIEQKQKQIDKIKNQYQQQLKKIEKENNAKKSMVQQQLIQKQEKIKIQLKDQYQEKTKKLEQQLRIQKNAQITERQKRQEQLKRKIEELQKQNNSLKTVQKKNLLSETNERINHQQHRRIQPNVHQQFNQIQQTHQKTQNKGNITHQQHKGIKVEIHQQVKSVEHHPPNESNLIAKQEQKHIGQYSHPVIQNTPHIQKVSQSSHIQSHKIQSMRGQENREIIQNLIEKEVSKRNQQNDLIQPPRIQKQIPEDKKQTQIKPLEYNEYQRQITNLD